MHDKNSFFPVRFRRKFMFNQFQFDCVPSAVDFTRSDAPEGITDQFSFTLRIWLDDFGRVPPKRGETILFPADPRPNEPVHEYRILDCRICPYGMTAKLTLGNKYV